MPRSKTHFPRVPLEIAEKAAEAETNGHTSDALQRSTMDCGIKYWWQEVVVDAFRSDPSDLSMRINVAERTISARIKESEIDFSERMALSDALRMLRVLISETEARRAEHARSRTAIARRERTTFGARGNPRRVSKGNDSAKGSASRP
jgi:hypothetical protein